MEEKGPYLAQSENSIAPVQQNSGYPPTVQQSNQDYPPAYQQNPGYLPQNPGYPPQNTGSPPVQHQSAPMQAQQYPGYVTSQPNVVIVTQSSSNPSGPNDVPLLNTTNNQRNKKQASSALPASFIFMSGGMNTAWSFAFGSVFPFISTHLRISWFIGAIIGAIFGAMAAKFVHKKFIFIGSAFLVTLGGILFMADPLNTNALIAARYLNGIANGLVFAPSLIIIGEEVFKQNRGVNAASVEGLAVSTGILVQLIFCSIWGFRYTGKTTEFGATDIHGLFCIVYGVMAFFYAIFFSIESPVFFLQRQDDQTATDCLRRRQRPQVPTQETYALLEEHKRYVAESNATSTSETVIAGLPALLKLCVYRGLVAMGYSYVMGSAIIFGSAALSSNTDFMWPVLIFGATRWLGSLISMFIMDSAGRKMQMLLATLVCAGMAIGVAVNYDYRRNIAITAYLLYVFQFFSGFFACSSSAYLTEAFPLAVKPFYLSFVYIVEMVVQIIVAVCVGNTFTMKIDEIISYFYALGALGFVFFVLAIFSIPETKRETLREAQAKFQSFKNFNLK